MSAGHLTFGLGVESRTDGLSWPSYAALAPVNWIRTHQFLLACAVTSGVMCGENPWISLSSLRKSNEPGIYDTAARSNSGDIITRPIPSILVRYSWLALYSSVSHSLKALREANVRMQLLARLSTTMAPTPERRVLMSRPYSPIRETVLSSTLKGTGRIAVPSVAP